ncbi:hypothetical protein [Francisella sp. 19X1-34]|uniref:hypothetical protein n=1 Tax=Francisella sp. 19X1-34 TaxID=3087177 RepID=UPI002E2F97C1|nr:hypothetical protein [Francisella sp. 19X1-34]MED7789329.1 hypothetical protein [Francisella sp. 19X1-34]
MRNIFLIISTLVILSSSATALEYQNMGDANSISQQKLQEIQYNKMRSMEDRITSVR